MKTKLFDHIQPVIFCLLLINTYAPVQAQTLIPDSILHRKWDTQLAFFNTQPWTPGCDSIPGREGKTIYFNLDSACHYTLTRSISERAEYMWYIYFVLNLAGQEYQQKYKDKLMEASKRYKNKALEGELDYVEVRYPQSERVVTFEKWNRAWQIINKYERRGDLQNKLHIMSTLLYKCTAFPTALIHEGIKNERLPVMKLYKEIQSTQDRLDGDYYQWQPASFYFDIGLIYHSFKYYEKAVPLLQKATELPQGPFYARDVMRARDYLGDYYALIGDYDRSDSLYLSILNSREEVLFRPVDDVVAIGAIAGNNNRRGYKEEAIRLYSIAVPRALEMNELTLSAGYALHLGRLHMEKGELSKTREMLDYACKYLYGSGNFLATIERYYTLNRDYCLATNQSANAALYIDSIAQIQKETEDTYNIQHAHAGLC